MARTTITPTPLAFNNSVADPTGTATGTGAGNGVSIASAFTEKTLLRIANASGGTLIASVKAGSGPASTAAGQGDLNVSVATGTTAWVGPLESARFQQSDGSLAVDAAGVVTVTAFRVSGH